MPDIRTVAVIGAGEMGRRIAHLAALAGYSTILEDVLPSSRRRAEDEFRNIIEKSIAAGKMSRSDAEAALKRLQYAGSVEEAARQADLVIEAVPDEWESKSEIFILLDKICKPETILVTSTRTLSVDEMASVTYRPAKIAGMRFGENEIEVTQEKDTDTATMKDCRELAERMCRKTALIREDASEDGNPSLRSR